MATIIPILIIFLCFFGCKVTTFLVDNQQNGGYNSENTKKQAFIFACSRIIRIFAADMISRQECIDRILANKHTIIEDYDVRSLRLFGSVARNEQKEASDVDVFVEMAPDLFQIIGLKEFLENLLGCSVDVVRKHRNNDLFLLKQIEKDGIDIFREPADRFAYA